MTNTEAEAVLLLLARPLTWFSKAGGAVEVAQANEPFQYVVCGSRQGLSVKYVAGHATRQLDEKVSTDYAPCLFDTSAAAKAACERHYATGEWD